MSSLPATPRKRNPKHFIKSYEDNNNTSNKFSERQQARTFVQWYKQMIDNERQSLALYMSDDAALEWFGRTIKSKKKIYAFLKYDMQCSKHDFTSVESIDKIVTRLQKPPRLVLCEFTSKQLDYVFISFTSCTYLPCLLPV